MIAEGFSYTPVYTWARTRRRFQCSSQCTVLLAGSVEGAEWPTLRPPISSDDNRLDEYTLDRGAISHRTLHVVRGGMSYSLDGK